MNIKIKEKKCLSQDIKKILFLRSIFISLSLGLGFIVSYYGKGSSYIEHNLLLTNITLFGFGMTATVFINQTLKESKEHNVTEKTKNVIKALAQSLLLIFILIIIACVLDFLSTLDFESLSAQSSVAEWVSLIVKSLSYSAQIYAMICHFDILLSFIVIIKNNK